MKKKKKKRRTASDRRKDAHHLCFQRRHWTHGAQKDLRMFHYCIISIPKDTLHRAIHVAVENVPEPKSANAQSALDQLRELERYGAISDADPIEKRLELLAALFDCVEQPTADGFRAQLDVVHKFKPPP